ncbi:hypothetical protein B0H11DRAFT_619204 [Mycena galericulata]|nr:hypothetical protein B0H11DRAFT_619204 [Mycena galericulata]
MASQPSTLDLNDLALQFTSKRHPHYPRVIDVISLKGNHPELGAIVSLKAWRISGAHCAGSSLRILDEDSDEMHQFSVTLFDKYGAVRPHLVDPGYRSGTGCWGREMNTGELIYILDIRVKKSHQGNGIGTWTLLQFLASTHVKIDDTVICWPTPVDINDENAWITVRNKQIAFFRKNQFRRIGRTHFFGYSPKADHPSRSIPLDADVGALEENFPKAVAPDGKELQNQFPLHSAIVNDRSASIVSTIQSFYDKDPASIHQADDKGFTPIFTATAAMNVLAVQKLLEWDLHADLRNAENVQGVTPLEGLADIMRSEREFVETFMDSWSGYPDAQLTVQALLKQAMGLTVNEDEMPKGQYCHGCGRACGHGAEDSGDSNDESDSENDGGSNDEDVGKLVTALAKMDGDKVVD